jgi:hypothetical protein
MRSSLPDLAIKMLELAFTGLVASSAAIIIKFNVIGCDVYALMCSKWVSRGSVGIGLQARFEVVKLNEDNNTPPLQYLYVQ